MIWQHIPYFKELIALMSSSLIVLILIFRSSSSRKYWRIRFFIALGSLVLFVSKFLEMGFVNIDLKLFWLKAQVLSIILFSTSLFVFSLYYSGREKWFNRMGILLLWIIPLASGILMFSDLFQTLVFENIRLAEIASFVVLKKEYGIWYWIVQSYSIFLILFSIIFLNRLKRGSYYKKQWQTLISILVLGVCPAISASLNFFDYYPYPYLEIIPFTLALGCLIVSATLYRLKEEEIIDVDNCSVMESVDDGIILLDKRGTILYINKIFKNYFDISHNLAVGQSLKNVFPDLSNKIEAYRYSNDYDKNLKTFNAFNGKTYDLNVSNLFDLTKKYVGKTVVLRDITEKQTTENILKESEEKFRLLFEKSSDGIFSYNISDDKIDINPALSRILGYSNNNGGINHKHLRSVLGFARDEIRSPHLSNGRSFIQKQINKKNNGTIWIEISFNRDINHDGDIIYNGIVRDITSKKVFEDKIKYLSFHDKLTGLYNRAFFEAEIKRLDKKRQLPLTVVIADIDGLKLINDAFGHENGDRQIKKIAGIFKTCFRSEDIIARYGGDEFSILLPNTTMEKALRIIDRVKETCKKESNRIIPLSTSIGVASKTEAEQDINSIIKEADDQMYRNKLMNRRSPHSSLIVSLEKALEERNFETVEHVRRMREGIIALGKELDLSESSINDLRLLSTLHDIGKIGISDNIILKPDKLNRKEWKVIKKHSEIGFRIAKSSNELSSIAKPILYHHEWWNGEGYPSKLKNEKIPISSRMVSIVDAYDAMTNDRPYRKALKKDFAIKELLSCSGTQFDPYLVDKFVKIC